MRSLQTLRRAARAPLAQWLSMVASLFALTAALPALADAPARLGSAASTATPYDPNAAPSMRLGYQDLNLSTPEGIAALYLRIRHAALQVCEPTRNTTGTRIDPSFERCVQGAVAATVRQIGSPGLAALEVEQRVLGEPGGGGRGLCERPARAKLII